MLFEKKEEVKKEEIDLPLHVKYRPKTLDEIIGQDAAVKSLRTLLQSSNLPHSYLFVGSSGCGKTTLARILARHLDCDDYNITEVDAATHNGVDDMRTLTEEVRYRGLGEKPIKFVILDECHMLSKGAWNSLLKAVEEPPSHVYFAFCTTEPGKVPETIKTRCTKYTLRDVKLDDLMDLVDLVAHEEGIDLPKGSLELIAKEATGSPRKALVNLAQVRGCTTREEVGRVLESAAGVTTVIDLCRMIIDKSITWDKVIKILKSLEETQPESIRIQIVNYITACILNARSEADTIRFLRLLDIFSKPIYQATGLSDILLSLGEVIFEEV